MVVQRRDWKDILTDRRRHQKPTEPTVTVATVRYMERIKAGEVVSFDRGYYPGQSIHTPASERPIVGVRVWDGKSYRGKPARLPIFCKPACGVEFALDAHQHGHRRRS